MSTPQCLLAVYVNQDHGLIPEFLGNLHSFFSKLPLPLEVTFILEKGSSITSQNLQQKIAQQTTPWIHFQVAQNAKKQGRAQSIAQTFSRSQAPYLASLSIELSAPLGDLFKLLQNLIGEENFAAALGNRYPKKGPSFSNVRTARAKNENLFRPIFLEKNGGDLQDPLCELFVVKQSVWSEIQTDFIGISGWYIAPHLHRALRKRDLKWTEVTVHDSGASSQSYHAFAQKLRLFGLSLRG